MFVFFFPLQCALKGGNSDSWMNPLSKQFSNMGLLVSNFFKI